MKRIINIFSILLVFILIMLSVIPAFGVTKVENPNLLSLENKSSFSLTSKLNELKSSDIVEVAIWLKDINIQTKNEAYDKKLKNENSKGNISDELYSKALSLNNFSKFTSKSYTLSDIQKLSSIKHLSNKDLHIERNNKLKDKIIDLSKDINIVYLSKYAPVVVAKTTKASLYKIALLEEVEFIYPWYDLSVQITDTLQNSEKNQNVGDNDYGVWQDITNIKTMRDEMGYDGEGIKIGIMEDGVPDVQNFALINSDINIVNGDSATNHATNTATILVGNTDDYSGIVPNASLYCAGYIRSYYDPIEDLLDCFINILNISNSLSAYPPNEYGTWSKYMDYIVYNYDVTVCMAAGNVGGFPDGVPGGAMAYNVITVGNLDDNNTLSYNDDEIDSTSYYVSSDLAPYKPDLCAPGDRVGTPNYPDRDINGRGGTSSATPIVSGICALLMEANINLTASPMLVKSILMSSAIRVPNMDYIYSTPTTIEPSLSRSYGAGLVDVVKAHSVADNENWNYIPLVTSDQSKNPYTLNVIVTQEDISSSKNLAVSLSWTQKVLSTSFNNSTLYPVYHHDLGIYDPNGNLVAYSNYQYDRKQFVYYKPLVAGTYRIKVYKTGIAQASVLTAFSYNVS